MINVMVNGLPGKMATAVAKQILQSEDIQLFPYSLTGSDITIGSYYIKDSIKDSKIILVRPEDREEFIHSVNSPFICVDYTHPSTVNENVDFYCKNHLPFVMGTTGGDRQALEQRVIHSDNVAVIAPNMAKQIVAFQAMMKYAADTFPAAFKGYSLEIAESHQKGKADTSGTAKAMVGYFNQLGIPFNVEQIVMIRDPVEQAKLGVPTHALSGHGWHTYTLKSEDKNVLFQFTHNVNGRDVYAPGTLDAVRFLTKKIIDGVGGKVYSMIDVLQDK